MATITPTWSASSQIEGTADGYTTLSATTEEYSASVDMTGSDVAHAIVEVNFDATPTDNVQVNVYGSLDGTNFDDVPMYSVIIDNGTDPSQITLVIDGVAYFRLGFVQTGSTDSHDVRAYQRKRSWSSA